VAEIVTLTVGDLDTNCYLVSCEYSGETLIIDPGDSGDFITQEIIDRHLQPMAIVLTHGHFDHVLGALELKLNFQIPLLLHHADEFLLKRAKESAEHWLKHPVDPVPTADGFVDDGQLIAFGDCHLQVRHVPGHTPGSIALFDDHNVFTGDTWFKDGPGKAEHSYGKPLELSKSLAVLHELGRDRFKYPGHGEMF